MGAKSAGAQAFWSNACVVTFGLAVVLVLAGCTGDESAAASPLPTSTSIATVETAAPTATATSVPTATPTPTVEPTATPEPSPTPSGTELYGPLLIEGAYDWPLDMPDDLTEDELFAINIFASAQNASFAAIEARSEDLSEFDPLDGLVVNEVVANSRDAIALDTTMGLTQRFAIDGPTDLIAIARGERSSDTLTFRTCEYIASTFLLDDGEEIEGEQFAVERDIRFAETQRGYVYEAWAIVDEQNGEEPTCEP